MSNSKVTFRPYGSNGISVLFLEGLDHFFSLLKEVVVGIVNSYFLVRDMIFGLDYKRFQVSII